MKKVKIGIIGLRHLHPRSYMTLFDAIETMEVIAVAEQDDGLRQKFVADFQLNGYADWHELYATEAIDLAAIFLPHIDCLPAAMEGIDHGIHLLIEKPMTVDSESAERIVRSAAKKNLLVTTPYVWRYHPVVQDIKRLIHEGALGTIIGCEGRCAAGRLNRYLEGHAAWMLDKNQSGGGPMYNLGVHWIDLFNYLLRAKVISAFGKNVRVNQAYNIEDNSFAILTYESGATLSLDISYTVPESYPNGRDLYIGIRGTKGVIQWSPAYEGEQDELFICSDHESFRSAPRQRRVYELGATPGYSGVMGLEYLKDVANAVINNKPAPILASDGVAVLKIVEAIYQSAQKNCAVSLNV